MKNKSHMIKVLEIVEHELEKGNVVFISGTGFCQYVQSLHHLDIITSEERFMFEDYLEEHTNYSSGSKVFIWTPGDKHVRLNWLRNRISIEKENLKTTDINNLKNIKYYNEYDKKKISSEKIVFWSFFAFTAIMFYKFLYWLFTR